MDIGKPVGPTPRKEWVQAGDTCVATDGPDAMRGKVLRILRRCLGSVDSARVEWANGHSGIRTITTLRKVTP